MNGIPPRVRALLQCPICQQPLTDDPDGLYCPQDKRLYPVVDGVPHLVLERSKKVGREE